MSIFQCLRVVDRSCKSQFVWYGTRRVIAAVYEFLLRDMAIRPLIDGVTELDPDEPAVPVTGLAFLCQQFVLLLRQRAMDGEVPAINLEEATEKLCMRVRSNDDKTVGCQNGRPLLSAFCTQTVGARFDVCPPTAPRCYAACTTLSTFLSPSTSSSVLFR